MFTQKGNDEKEDECCIPHVDTHVGKMICPQIWIQIIKVEVYVVDVQIKVGHSWVVTDAEKEGFRQSEIDEYW